MESQNLIRSWGVGQFAQLYFPEATPSSAYSQLKRWISYEPGLKEKLREAGWRPFRKMYTPKQVAILVECFGEP